jgi:hypothetical protein
MVEKRYAGQNKTQRDLNALIDEVAGVQAELSALDHGALSGLDDDDHPQYLTEARHTGAHVAARVYRNANQSIPDGTVTSLAFNSVRYDTGGMYDPDASSLLTCQVAGLYLITGHVVFGQHANGYREVYIRLIPASGSAAHIAVASAQPLGTKTPTPLSVATAWYMEPGDYVQLQVRQNSGGALAVLAEGAYSPEFTMTRIG